MTPTEFWWEAEMRMPKKTYGSMTEDEVREIYEKTYGDSNR